MGKAKEYAIQTKHGEILTFAGPRTKDQARAALLKGDKLVERCVSGWKISR